MDAPGRYAGKGCYTCCFTRAGKTFGRRLTSAEVRSILHVVELSPIWLCDHIEDKLQTAYMLAGNLGYIITNKMTLACRSGIMRIRTSHGQNQHLKLLNNRHDNHDFIHLIL